MEYFFTDNILIKLESGIIELSDGEPNVTFKLDSNLTDKLFEKNPDLKSQLLSTGSQGIKTNQTTNHIHHFAENIEGSNKNLFGIDLSNQDLTNANLIYPNLASANLTKANLSGLNLSSAILSRANLNETNLTNSNLKNIILYQANLTNADLSGADLSGGSLLEANLTKANLTKANLTKAGFAYSNLSNANLTGANLTNAEFAIAKINCADLTDCYIEECSKPPAEPGEKCALSPYRKGKWDTQNWPLWRGEPAFLPDGRPNKFNTFNNEVCPKIFTSSN